jgi:hypothetical protein
MNLSIKIIKPNLKLATGSRADGIATNQSTKPFTKPNLIIISQ